MADGYMRGRGYVGNRGISYTPFAADAGATMAAAMGERQDRQREKRENELASSAYMGDPQALEELAAQNPELAMQIEDQAGQRQQRERSAEQHQQAMEAKRRQFATENRELMQDLYAQIGQFDDFEQAATYAAEQKGQLESIMGPGNVPLQELTPEAHERFKALRTIVTGDDWERSGGPVIEDINGKPVYVQKFVNPKTREVESIPLGMERAITGWDPQRRGDIKQTEKREGTKEERLQTNIDKGLTSAQGVPELKRAKELLTQVQTGGIQTNLNAVRQYFGDDSKEVADMGELRVLLAQDLIDKFSLMTGVLSESDMKLLQSIAAGTERSTAVNQRLMDNLIRKSERNILRALDDAREGGRPSEVRELEKYARELGLTEYEIQTGDKGGSPDPEQEPGAGTSRDNPIVAQPGDPRPKSGTWVKLPDGRVVKVP